MSEQSHRSDPRVLSRRTLERDHRRLAALLQPGMHVLDVGCGTGAITAGIWRAVGPAGSVTGVDRDDALIDIARVQNPGMEFVNGDILQMDFSAAFDVVNAARSLQWVSDPAAAVARMCAAAKPGGIVIALDYDHADNAWLPDPPVEFRDFYRAFLRWRAANGWDNRMATHLPEMFAQAGLTAIESTIDDEFAGPGDDAAHIWLHVMESIGPTMDRAGFLASGWQAGVDIYRHWIRERLQLQTLVMRTITGRVRDSHR